MIGIKKVLQDRWELGWVLDGRGQHLRWNDEEREKP